MLDRFHPATRRVKEIIDSGELGTLTNIEASLAVPGGFIKDNDIRMAYNLGGGAMMDMGCEFKNAVSVSCVFHDASPCRLHFIYVALPSRRRSYEGYQC